MSKKELILLMALVIASVCISAAVLYWLVKVAVMVWGVL